MIISHKNKFIFIKTEKTAGTSIEIALSEICGPEDIITPISKIDEQHRLELGFRGKQNYHLPIKYYDKNHFFHLLFFAKRARYYNHIGAVQIRKYIGEKIWNNYYKFTFERNPFDKLISWYYWCGGENKFSSIENFIKGGFASKVKGFDLYTENFNIIVDKVYHFENLNDSLDDISTKLKLQKQLSLPIKKAKGDTRIDKRHYREILTQFEKDWVMKEYAREMAYFNYNF